MAGLPCIENIPAEVLAMAITIADESTRSDIECHALSRWHGDQGGWMSFSTTELVTAGSGPEATHQAMQDLALVQRAANYIRARGNNFPWRMIEVPDEPGCIRFIDKEGRPIDPGVPV